MLRRIILLLPVAALLLVGIAYLAAARSPAVRVYRVTFADWPAGVPPLRLVFLSDTHVAGPDMPPARLAGIVDRVNALRPDCVLLGGDYVSEKSVATQTYSFAEAVAPFANLRPRIATIGVDGNHDWVPDPSGQPIAVALRRVGVRVLANAVTRCGPLTIAGIRNLYSGLADVRTVATAARLRGGPSLLLSHTPDVFTDAAALSFPLVLTGHTHCGQIALPWYGAVVTATTIGRHYACGLVREHGRVLIVGAGLGTSGVPLRLFTRPEIMVVDLGRAAPAVRPVSRASRGLRM